MRERATEAIHMRITPQIKALLQQAAVLSGYTSLTGFISHIATQEAKKIIRQEDATLISDESMDYVLNLLKNPPIPNENLKALMKKVKEQQLQDK